MLSEIEGFVNWTRRRSPEARTWKDYGYDLYFFMQVVGDRPLREVTFKDIDHFIAVQSERGFKPSTINRRLASILSLYAFLMVEDDQLVCPVLQRRHHLREPQRLPRPVQEDDLKLFFSVISSARDRAMFLLMLRCGLRVGEVRNLSMNDLYLDPTTGNLPRVWLHGKGSYERVMYLSSQPLVALKTWLEIRPKVKHEAVFINRFGKRLSVTGIQDRLAGYCHKTGLWVTCHQFRHTFGRHLTEARVPVTSIQRLFGHARLESTEVYLHISDAQAQEDYLSAMNEISLALQPTDCGASVRELPLCSEVGS
jgi:site-specific recombinase XerC